MMKAFAIFSAIWLSGYYSTYAGFVPPEMPKDKVVRLAVPLTAPKGSNRDYKIGEAVSILNNDGILRRKDTSAKSVRI